MESESINTSSFDPCARFEAELVAYMEGEQSPLLLAHAEQCDFCRCVLRDLQQIRTISFEVELEAPSPAVWSHVRSALIAEGVIRKRDGFGRRWASGWGARLRGAPIPAGAVAAAIVAAVVLWVAPGYLIRSHIQAHAVRAAMVENYMAPADAAQLQHTIRQLEVAYRANESLLEPSMKAAYQNGLASLNDEIRECQSSMAQDPADGLARQYLSTAYDQKVQLLQSALEFNLR